MPNCIVFKFHKQFISKKYTVVLKRLRITSKRNNTYITIDTRRRVMTSPMTTDTVVTNVHVVALAHIELLVPNFLVSFCHVAAAGGGGGGRLTLCKLSSSGSGG